jgi:hypothetical protein
MEIAMSYIRRESSDGLDSVRESLKSSEEWGQRPSRGWTLFGALLIGERNT